jgi:hypothetical protein
LELCPNISALKMETQESSIQFINNIICWQCESNSHVWIYI